jgi:transposase
MLVEAAGSVGSSKYNYLSAQHARLMARRGRSRAQVAVAHSILVSAYCMLSRGRALPRSRAGLAMPPRRRGAGPAGWSPNSNGLGRTVVLDPAPERPG